MPRLLIENIKLVFVALEKSPDVIQYLLDLGIIILLPQILPDVSGIFKGDDKYLGILPGI